MILPRMPALPPAQDALNLVARQVYYGSRRDWYLHTSPSSLPPSLGKSLLLYLLYSAYSEPNLPTFVLTDARPYSRYRGNCRSAWHRWGRWVLAGILIFIALVFIFLFLYVYLFFLPLSFSPQASPTNRHGPLTSNPRSAAAHPAAAAATTKRTRSPPP